MSNPGFNERACRSATLLGCRIMRRLAYVFPPISSCCLTHVMNGGTQRWIIAIGRDTQEWRRQMVVRTRSASPLAEQREPRIVKVKELLASLHRARPNDRYADCSLASTADHEGSMVCTQSIPEAPDSSLGSTSFTS